MQWTILPNENQYEVSKIGFTDSPLDNIGKDYEINLYTTAISKLNTLEMKCFIKMIGVTRTVRIQNTGYCIIELMLLNRL